MQNILACIHVHHPSNTSYSAFCYDDAKISEMKN